MDPSEKIPCGSSQGILIRTNCINFLIDNVADFA